MRIITDFDGPIMDLSDRYYHVYQLCLETVKQPNQPITIFSKAKFWAYKQAQIPELQLGIESGLTATQAQAFKEMRDLHAHQLQYLSLDLVVPGSIAALAKIQASGSDLLVMTLRRTCELEPAFQQYNLDRFFPSHHRYCLPNDYIKHGDVQAKTQLMTNALAALKPDPDTWMIGDTEADIIAAQTYNIPVIGVLSGIRDRDRLERYQPDKIVANLADAVDFIFDL
ncbi:HAD family hydrolase [Chamaesiphon sp. VAR_48_metabat_403]|uniref:HAD family hydrolase n=1 Tax=Chamaesiphon sp. VAR_48_metabat_403 TaxID=2964700 RepID=UPI00286D8DF4|nr:HAD family hydrolase [Chamaesiphon sp. VAR_48_metabat_403]